MELPFCDALLGLAAHHLVQSDPAYCDLVEHVICEFKTSSHIYGKNLVFHSNKYGVCKLWKQDFLHAVIYLSL
jgi:hypothetical protein